ncbi:unnamed protein product [Rhizophagus irregularis]|nr:unnamed protein product [Rhizophagus irregularis]
MSSKSSKSIKSNNPLSAFAPKTLSSSSKEISSVTLKDSASNVQDNIRVNDSSSEIEHHKRKSINTLQIKASRLSKKDAETLSKALYYSKKAYKKALLAKESSVYTENTINEFIKLQSSCNESNENSNGKSKGHTKKKQFWYSVNATILPDPSGEIMYEFIYNNLKKAHPENVSKIENNTAGEWKKFWREARNKFRTRHANYVKNIKSAISNTFGKVFLREIPGQKTSFDEITNWKIQQMFFVDLIFDVNVQVITLSGETITKRIEKLNNNKKKQEEQEDNDQEGESDD